VFFWRLYTKHYCTVLPKEWIALKKSVFRNTKKILSDIAIELIRGELKLRRQQKNSLLRENPRIWIGDEA